MTNAVREYLSFDLGTSESRVLYRTKDNGNEEVRVAKILTLAGRPTDYQALDALKELGAVKKDARLEDAVLVGDEVNEYRDLLTVTRPLERGQIAGYEQSTSDEFQRNLADVRKIVNKLARKVSAKPSESLVGAISAPVVAASESKKELRDLLKTYAVTGNAMIVSQAYTAPWGAIEAGKVSMKDARHSLWDDIGAGSHDAGYFDGTRPMDGLTASSPLAGDSVDHALAKQLAKRYGKEFPNLWVRDVKEKYGLVEQNGLGPQIMALNIHGSSKSEDITDLLIESGRPQVTVVSDVVLKVLGNVNPEYQKETMGKVYLVGRGSRVRGLAQGVEKELNSRSLKDSEVKAHVTALDDDGTWTLKGTDRLLRNTPAEKLALI